MPTIDAESDRFWLEDLRDPDTETPANQADSREDAQSFQQDIAAHLETRLPRDVLKRLSENDLLTLAERIYDSVSEERRSERTDKAVEKAATNTEKTGLALLDAISTAEARAVTDEIGIRDVEQWAQQRLDKQAA